MLAFLLAAGLPGGGSALAQDKAPADEARDAAMQAMSRILKALGSVMDSIPQYEMPEVQANGDIIIRRKNPPPPAPAKPAEPPPGQQRT